MGFNMLITFSTTLLLVYTSFKKQKPSIEERKRREEEIIARAQLRLKSLEKEANHETELNRLKSGLDGWEELKEKGEKLVQEKAEEAKKGIGDKLSEIKKKFTI